MSATVGNWFFRCQLEIAGKFCQRRWWWQLASDFCQCQLALAGERWWWRWVATASKAAPPVAMAASAREHQNSQYVFLSFVCDLICEYWDNLYINWSVRNFQTRAMTISTCEHQTVLFFVCELVTQRKSSTWRHQTDHQLIWKKLKRILNYQNNCGTIKQGVSFSFFMTWHQSCWESSFVGHERGYNVLTTMQTSICNFDCSSDLDLRDRPFLLGLKRKQKNHQGPTW